jgi:hypothetical protein
MPDFILACVVSLLLVDPKIAACLSVVLAGNGARVFIVAQADEF